MQETTQVLRVAPIAQTQCVELLSLIDFAAKGLGVEVDRQEWHGNTQSFIVHLYGPREGIMKVSMMVQEDYPDLRVTLETLDEPGGSTLN